MDIRTARKLLAFAQEAEIDPALIRFWYRNPAHLSLAAHLALRKAAGEDEGEFRAWCELSRARRVTR